MNAYDDLVARLRGAYTEYDRLVRKLRRPSFRLWRRLRTSLQLALERVKRTLQAIEQRSVTAEFFPQSIPQAGELAIQIVLFACLIFGPLLVAGAF